MLPIMVAATIGSGIRKMFLIQKKRYVPLPEYELQDNRVQVIITGRVVDMAYARKLAEYPDLTLEDILLLDRVHIPAQDEQLFWLNMNTDSGLS